MKKIIIIALFILIVCSVNLFAGGSEIGFKGGGGIGWVTGDDLQDFLTLTSGDNRVKFNYSVGAFLDLSVANWLSIQPEVLLTYLVGGYRYDYYYYDYYFYYSGEVKGTLDVYSLEIPIYVKPKINVGSGMLYFIAGPDIFFLLGDVTEEVKLDGVSMGELKVEPDNSFLFGIAGGLGVKIRNTSIEIKYSKTMTEIFENVDWSFNGFVLYIGYSFPIEK